MEFSSWTELFLENPHKSFQKRASAPDRLLRVGREGGLLATGLHGQGPLPSLDPWPTL